jgi:arsenate reductase
MKILFMCADNSGYSQLAEALARQILSDEAHIASAGFQADRIHPEAAQALQDIGVDPGRLKTKRLEDLSADFLHELDFVITLCDGELSAPQLEHAKHLHWPFPESTSGQVDYRTTVTHLRTQIVEFGREYDILRGLPPPQESEAYQPGL